MSETQTEIDWYAAEAIAQGLGSHTRELVARRDPYAVRSWALRAAQDHDVYGANGLRAASYLELAVLVGSGVTDEEEDEDDEGDAG